MDSRRLGVTCLAALSVFLPLTTFERLTNFYYLTGSQMFGLFSGARTEVFIAFAILSPIIVARLTKSFLSTALGSAIGVSAFVAVVYVGCDPRLCYSLGIDGWEPLRIIVFLGSLAVCGSGLGDRVATPRSAFLLSTCTVIGASFLPMEFLAAGTRLVAPFDPWDVALFLMLLSLWSSWSSGMGRGRRGPAAPLVGAAVSFALGFSISTAYWLDLVYPFLLCTLAVALGTAIGAGLPKGSVRVPKASILGAVVLVILMTVGVIPDAVSGLASDAPDGHGGLSMASPLFAGGFMDSPLGATKGVSLGVAFSPNITGSVGPDNYLSAGIGAHSPGCCIDGIDYGYRFDLVVLPKGRTMMSAAAWEVCDYNAACGLHPWKELMFQSNSLVSLGNLSQPTTLAMQWQGHAVVWWYSKGGSSRTNFTSFEAPTVENPYFDLGELVGPSLLWSEAGAFFFQFGVMSRAPLKSTSWDVRFECPAYLPVSKNYTGGSFVCTPRAGTMQGDQSFWKALWRWGETYPAISIISVGNYSFELGPSDGAPQMTSFERLWG